MLQLDAADGMGYKSAQRAVDKAAAELRDVTEEARALLAAERPEQEVSVKARNPAGSSGCAHPQHSSNVCSLQVATLEYMFEHMASGDVQLGGRLVVMPPGRRIKDVSRFVKSGRLDVAWPPQPWGDMASLLT